MTLQIKVTLTCDRCHAQHNQSTKVSVSIDEVIQSAGWQATLRHHLCPTCQEQTGIVVYGSQTPIPDRHPEYAAHQLQVAAYRFWVITPLLSLDQYYRDLVVDRVAEVRTLLQTQPFPTSSRQPKHLQAVSVTTIYRWLQLFDHAGQQWQALIPAYTRCGRGMRIEPQVVSIMMDSFAKCNTTLPFVTVDKVAAQIETQIAHYNQSFPPELWLTLPSRGSIYHYYRQYKQAHKTVG